MLKNLNSHGFDSSSGITHLVVCSKYCNIIKIHKNKPLYYSILSYCTFDAGILVERLGAKQNSGTINFKKK